MSKKVMSIVRRSPPFLAAMVVMALLAVIFFVTGTNPGRAQESNPGMDPECEWATPVTNETTNCVSGNLSISNAATPEIQAWLSATQEVKITFVASVSNGAYQVITQIVQKVALNPSDSCQDIVTTNSFNRALCVSNFEWTCTGSIVSNMTVTNCNSSIFTIWTTNAGKYVATCTATASGECLPSPATISGDATASVIKVELTAFRPTTEGTGYGNPFRKCEVPDSKEENPGAGIRINGDDDNHNGSPDGEDESVAGERSLIEVKLEAVPQTTPSDVEYILKMNANNINAWRTQTKGSGDEILACFYESPLNVATLKFSSASMTVWVENPAGGTDDIELIARKKSDSSSICSDKAHFYPFTSVIIALGGFQQPPSDPADANHGIFIMATNLYASGYDVHMYDEDEVHNGGIGDPYDEVVRACQSRDAAHFAVYGYSRGGGAMWDLTSGLHANESIDAAISAWVDAVESGGFTNTAHDPERRRPLFSGFHVNYYQRIGGYTLMGDSLTDSMPWDFQLNTSAEYWRDSNGNPLNHFTIDDDVRIIDGIKSQIEATVPR